MPSKLNSRHAGGEELERPLLPLTSVLMSNCSSGSTSDYVAGRSAAYDTRLYFVFSLTFLWNGMEWNRIIFIMLLSMLMVDFMHLSAAIPCE